MSTQIPTYDQLHSFAVAMHQIEWQYSEEPGSVVLEFFEKPHKWDAEFAKWQELGGSLDKECVDRLEFYLDRKNDSGECAKCGGRASDSQHDTKHPSIGSHEFEDDE